MRSEIQLNVTPVGAEITDSSRGISALTAAIVVLVPSKGRAAVAIVGQHEDTTRRQIDEQTSQGTLPTGFKILTAGQDAWWDAEWAWPPRQVRLSSAPKDDSSALIIYPLRSETWSPRVFDALLRYAIYTSLTDWRSRSGYFRKPIRLSMSSEFSDVQRAELLDVVVNNWGRWRVRGHEEIARLSLPRARLARPVAIAVLVVLCVVQAKFHVVGVAPFLLLAVTIIFAIEVAERTSRRSLAPRREEVRILEKGPDP